jgi:hypothetical protein
MIPAMKQSTRVRVAAAVTTLFVGGLAAVGIALRSGGGSTAQEVAAPKPQVIHRTKIRRVPAKQRKPAPSKAPAQTPVSSPAPAPAPAPAAAPVVSAPAAQPAVVNAPPRVTSRTSPSGGGGGENEGGEGEGGSEHEGGDE